MSEDFQCDVCKKTFPPDPRTMVETGVEAVEVTEWEAKEMATYGGTISSKDPDFEKWKSGAMCICIECQDGMDSQ